MDTAHPVTLAALLPRLMYRPGYIRNLSYRSIDLLIKGLRVRDKD